MYRCIKLLRILQERNLMKEWVSWYFVRFPLASIHYRYEPRVPTDRPTFKSYNSWPIRFPLVVIPHKKESNEKEKIKKRVLALCISHEKQHTSVQDGRLFRPTFRHATSSVNLSAKLANNPQFQPHSIQIFTKTHPFETNFSSFYTSEAAVWWFLCNFATHSAKSARHIAR